MRRLIGLAVVLAVATSASADELWDNNIIPNGSGGRAISPPSFPGIRVADDFVVPRDSDGWIVEAIHYDGVEDGGWLWNDGDGIEVFVYEDTGGNGPGKLIATRTPGGSKMSTDRTLFGLDEYVYWAEFQNDPIKLEPGSYWIGPRHPSGGGSATNYWLTSDGGPDGGSSSTGYFSLNRGVDWMPEGDIYHHAFVIIGETVAGACDPCDTNCDGSVNPADVEPFVALLLGGDESCGACTGDTNDDGSIDLADIEGFIACLLE